MKFQISDLQKARARKAGNFLLSWVLLALDFTWQCLKKTWDVASPFVPWLAGLIALGISLGVILVSAGYVIARYGEILAIPVNPIEVGFVWGLAALITAIGWLGLLMLRVTGHLTMNISSYLQDTAAQVARLANASQERRQRRTTIAKPQPAAGQGEFVPYSDEMGFQNELAAQMRMQGMAEERITETLEQAGRTINESETEQTPLG